MHIRWIVGRPGERDETAVTVPVRPVAAPFVAAAPTGARVRARLRLSPKDEAVLRAAGGHLGSLAGRDLAARCAEGRLDARGRAESRRVRKKALTAKSSSRWAGAITRTSEDACTGSRSGTCGRSGPASWPGIHRIEARLAVPAAGTRAGRVPGYPTRAERHSKTVRVQALRTRLTKVEQQLQTGRVSVCRGGKTLLHKRNNLGAAALTEARVAREQWTASRLFLTADGEKDKTWGNETIRWNPTRTGWRSGSPPRCCISPTGPTGATGSRARLSSPTEAAT